MANDHFVQRALINFWSTLKVDGKLDKFVYLYDFTDGSLKRKSTKSVFSKEGLNSADLEKRVARLIDDPIGKIAHEHIAHRRGGPQPKLIEDDLAAWRAVGIIFTMQIARSFDGTGQTTDSLAKMMALTDEQLSSYAKIFWDGHTVGSYFMPANVALFLPEMGSYMFPALTAEGVPLTGASWVNALPITPQTVIYAATKGVDIEPSKLNAAAIGNFSVGMGALNSKLVVSPLLVESHGLDAMRREIPEMRKLVNDQRDRIEKIRRLEANIFATLGLQPPVTMP